KGVLQTVVILSGLTTGNFCTRSPDLQAVEDAMLPGSIICSFANEIVQSPPIAFSNWLVPIVEVGQDDTDAPSGTGIPDRTQEGQRLLDAGVRFFSRGPTWILSQASAARAARGVEVADNHVIEEDVV